MYDGELGRLCHWCGKYVTGKRFPKCGKHMFCCDGHKMAHARAFAKWSKRCVTAGRISTSPPGCCSSSKGNAQGKAATRSSSGAISLGPAPGSNAKKRGKR